MNSTVQQLFMIPKFQKEILDSKYDEPEKLIDENALLQLKVRKNLHISQFFSRNYFME